MNQKQKPFDNADIRKAVAYAINKQAFIDTFYAGLAGRPTTGCRRHPVLQGRSNLPTYDVREGQGRDRRVRRDRET